MATAAASGREWRWRALAALCAAGGLAACGTQPPLLDWGPPPAQTSPPAPSEAAAPAAQPAEAPAATPAPPSPGLAALPQNPARLVGMSHELVRSLLGEAVFVRRDGPVQIWRYAADTCFLDVFLFRETDNVFRVHHVEARAKGTERTTVPTCYGRLLAGSRG